MDFSPDDGLQTRRLWSESMTDTKPSTAFERLGGEQGLRPIIEDFVDRMVQDVMIGFFFRKVDVPRLKEMEYQFTAQFLGAELSYEGKPIGKAHSPHRIMGGQFDRRTQLLREAMLRHAVPADLQEIWLAHVEALRGRVTGQGPGECR
jgi:hemoglobin